MVSEVDVVRSVTAVALNKLNDASAALLAEMEQARAFLADSEQKLAEIERKREALKVGESLQLDALGHVEPRIRTRSGPPPAPVNDVAKRRARIGPQRYLIFSALDKMGELTVSSLHNLTRLSPRRIKDQLRADIPEMIEEKVNWNDEEESDDSVYFLNASGRDLLARFENYKFSRGEDLPTIADAGDDDSSAEENATDIRELVG